MAMVHHLALAHGSLPLGTFFGGQWIQLGHLGGSGTIKKHDTTKQRRLENHGSKGLLRNPWSLEPRDAKCSAVDSPPRP